MTQEQLAKNFKESLENYFEYMVKVGNIPVLQKGNLYKYSVNIMLENGKCWFSNQCLILERGQHYEDNNGEGG